LLKQESLLGIKIQGLLDRLWYLKEISILVVREWGLTIQIKVLTWQLKRLDLKEKKAEK
jgi:hypothetical protein